MKEIKHIVHAFLLITAGIVILFCIKTIFLSVQNSPVSEGVIIDDIANLPPLPAKGRQLFMANCASWNATGPSLCGFEERGPWNDRENVYEWIRNPEQFMKKNEYAKELKESFSGYMMTAFPNLTNEEIDEIINYINSACNRYNPTSPIASAN